MSTNDNEAVESPTPDSEYLCASAAFALDITSTLTLTQRLLGKQERVQIKNKRAREVAPSRRDEGWDIEEGKHGVSEWLRRGNSN